MFTAEEEERAFAWLQKVEKTADPAIRAREEMLLGWMLERLPESRMRIEEAGALREARKALRRVLKARGLVLGADEEARVEACTVLDTIERWLDQAAVAASVGEALR